MRTKTQSKEQRSPKANDFRFTPTKKTLSLFPSQVYSRPATRTSAALSTVSHFLTEFAGSSSSRGPTSIEKHVQSFQAEEYTALFQEVIHYTNEMFIYFPNFYCGFSSSEQSVILTWSKPVPGISSYQQLVSWVAQTVRLKLVVAQQTRGPCGKHVGKTRGSNMNV